MDQPKVPQLAPDLDLLPLPDGSSIPLKQIKPRGKKKKPLAPPGKPGRPALIEKRLPTIVALAGQYGWSYRQIAEYLSAQEGQEVSSQAVRSALYRLRKNGQLVDTEHKLAHLAVPLAIDTLIKSLEEDDTKAALETLKGMGLFRQHSAVKQEGPTKMELQVSFVRPEGAEEQVIEGQIVGSPRRLEE